MSAMCPECGFDPDDHVTAAKCAARQALVAARRADLRVGLNRAPPPCRECGCSGGHSGRCTRPLTLRSEVTDACVYVAWREWFGGGAFLGVSSARTGPDTAISSQKCDCDVCVRGRR